MTLIKDLKEWPFQADFEKPEPWTSKVAKQSAKPDVWPEVQPQPWMGKLAEPKAWYLVGTLIRALSGWASPVCKKAVCKAWNLVECSFNAFNPSMSDLAYSLRAEKSINSHLGFLSTRRVPNQQNQSGHSVCSSRHKMGIWPWYALRQMIGIWSFCQCDIFFGLIGFHICGQTHDFHAWCISTYMSCII